MSLRRANLSLASLCNTTLIDATLDGADLTTAYLKGADLSGAGLRGTNLTSAFLGEAKLTRADFSNANLNGASISGSDFQGADLFSANLAGAFASKTNLSGVGLRDANLTGADLRDANLSSADLRGTNLSLAILKNTDFSGAIAGWTIFGDIDLELAIGLEQVRHLGPSTIGIHALYKFRQKLPTVFLRGVGVPNKFLSYLGALVGKQTEYHSCFISYSAKDQEFANRLYLDLLASGVRCWFAPEDLKIGDTFRDKIEESIRMHDKLLIILSKNSVRSPWVATEVESAFEREHRQSSLPVLFPIRLDTEVMKTDRAWAAEIRRRRHIGDFSRWKDGNAYAKALDRLLDDLKSDS